jgi:hypothetical protein
MIELAVGLSLLEGVRKLLEISNQVKTLRTNPNATPEAIDRAVVAFQGEIRSFVAQNNEQLNQLSTNQNLLAQEVSRLSLRQDNSEDVLRIIVSELVGKLSLASQSVDRPKAADYVQQSSQPPTRGIARPNNDTTTVYVDYGLSFVDAAKLAGFDPTYICDMSAFSTGSERPLNPDAIHKPLLDWKWSDWGVEMNMFGRQPTQMALRSIDGAKDAWHDVQRLQIPAVASGTRYADLRESLAFVEQQNKSYLDEFDIMTVAKPFSYASQRAAMRQVRGPGWFKDAQSELYWTWGNNRFVFPTIGVYSGALNLRPYGMKSIAKALVVIH